MSLDRDGEVSWIRAIGQSTASISGVASDPQGNIVATGSFSSSRIDLDPGPGESIHRGRGESDGFVVKLSRLGEFLAGMTFGGSANDEGTDLALRAESENTPLVTGSFEGSLDFDPGSRPREQSSPPLPNIRRGGEATQEGFVLALQPGLLSQ